ncbi:hypothetical protein [Variovorax sp. dw_308]|uniref:hypothetical protein n=1 Tax=Variovorax sp. dw_308 TaxID=2721546 RepID=UPI001C43AC6F|nr:hypothetical protein [Variovorax sp. dw_308]
MIDREFKHRGPAINVELAERYLRYGTHELEKRVGDAGASAQRTATQLASTAKNFDSVLSDGDQLALRAARAAMRKLATDLKALKPWAKAYAAFALDKHLRELDKHYADEAAKRWPGDAGLEAEALDLVDFFSKGDEGAAVEAFVLARHPGHTHVYLTSSGGATIDARQRITGALKAGDMVQVRRYCLEILEDMSSGFSSDRTWFASRGDYDAWAEARRRARATTKAAVTLATETSRR